MSNTALAKESHQNIMGSKYLKADREHAATLFIMLGNLYRVSQVTGIPSTTLFGWSKKNWWQELLERLRQEKKTELDANLTRIIDKSLQNIEKSLEFNDIKPKDAATIMGICFDKRQILNMKPTNITTSFKINDLAQQFQDYVAGKTIEGETTKD